jgi:hypothetical protein
LVTTEASSYGSAGHAVPVSDVIAVERIQAAAPMAAFA